MKIEIGHRYHFQMQWDLAEPRCQMYYPTCGEDVLVVDKGKWGSFTILDDKGGVGHAYPEELGPPRDTEEDDT